MTDRHGRIAEAYEKTFEWIFRDSGVGDKPWTSFTQWLKTDSSLYWITGKAGSGKSTLIKYLYRDARTIKHLEPWASGVPLVTAAFFFWNSGTNMQMSQTGLLQSILVQTLLKCPDLIPRILPERWEAYSLFGDDHHPPSEIELRQAFRLLTNEDPSATRFCFFIDGLDEFDGDHANLLDLLKDVYGAKHIKICVSSRPWVVFEDAFKRSPSLMLQDLTYPDILHFVKSRFHRDTRFAEFQRREPQYADQLLEAIAQKAAGVFLWVHLVVRSLLAGLGNGDRISDLQRRLDSLPPDLENLYQKILNSLDPFYLEHASQYFQLIRVAKEPPSLLSLSFADEEPNFVLRRKVQPLTADEILSRADLMKRRLNSRCKGLLEVVSNPIPFWDPFCSIDTANDSSLPGQDNQPFPIQPSNPADLTVQYLHRTVKDFLESPNVWDRLMAAKRSEYDPYLALCGSHIVQFKALPPKSLTRDTLWLMVERCMYYAYLAQKESEDSLVPLLDEFDRTVTELTGTPILDDSTFVDTCGPFKDCRSRQYSKAGFLRPHWTSTMFKDVHSTAGRTFLSLAVKLNLHSYVKAKIKNGCLVKQDTAIWPLLGDSIMIDPDFQRLFPSHPFPSSKMVNLLLESGADPNRTIPGKDYTLWEGIPGSGKDFTVWERMLWQPHDRDEMVWLDVWLDIMSQFLAHGATPSVGQGFLGRPRKRVTQEEWNRWMVSPRLCHYLQHFRSQKIGGWFGWCTGSPKSPSLLMKDIAQMRKDLKLGKPTSGPLA